MAFAFRISFALPVLSAMTLGLFSSTALAAPSTDAGVAAPVKAPPPPATVSADGGAASAPKKVPAVPAAAAGSDGGAVTRAPESVDDQARFLAGLPVPEGSPLYAFEQTAWWKAYAKHLDTDWGKAREQRLDPMAAWGAKELTPKIDPKAPVFYLFGGPDFLSVSVLYPDAPLYILCGLEPLGKLPRLGTLGAGALDESLKNLRLSLNSIIRLSFFKTNDMAGDLTRTELRGVLPLLLVFAARADARVLEVTRVEIADDGALKEVGDGESLTGIPGVRLRIQRAGHATTQDLYYFKHNIEDAVIAAGPGFYSFFEKHAPANTFLKAASFLLHRPKQFGKSHDFLLLNSRSILQDDSGLPFASLSKDSWDLTLFGTYLPPRPPFKMRVQPDMAAAFKEGPVQPLPFITGYRRTNESNLVLAVPKAGGRAVDAGVAPAPPGK